MIGRVALGLLVGIVGCAATSNGGASGTEGGSCDELQASARAEVSAALDARRTCTQASDCVGVALAASCFDSCGRAMRTDGQADLEAAKTKVDGAQCKRFLDQGCKKVVPPCAPPSPPTCTGGLCTN